MNRTHHDNWTQQGMRRGEWPSAPTGCWSRVGRWRKAIALLSTVSLTTPLLVGIWMSPKSATAVPHRPSWLKASDEPADFIRTPALCPDEVENLTELMLRDVPSYGNRVSQRSRRSVNDILPQSHILSSSPANITSLDPSQYQTIPPIEEIRAQGLESIFFTTLERQSLQNEAVLLQHYHWAFLADTSQGWELAFMYSTLGGYPATDPPTPPRDNNQGVIAQAIRLWLRDCEAGSVKAPEED
ncbi:MAG: hypothetical protein VKL39_11375 [Leptolyngbyaceae bacterium]|nr:hypothetical protein [Leptolyngbyaceae bacterium]